MQVTELRKNLSSKKLNEVYVDYEYAFSLYDNELVSFNIKEGKEIESETLDKIYKKLKKNAVNDSMRYLMRSDYTKKTISEKLALKKYPKDIINSVLNYLEENGFINDFSYAKHFVKSAFLKGKGKKYIEFELKKRGIKEEEIENLICDYKDQSKISDVSEKKWKAIIGNKDVPDYKDYNKLRDYLIRQGFSYEEISEELSRVKGSYED